MESPAPLISHRVVAGEDGGPELVKVARTEAGRARLHHEAAVLDRVAHPDVVVVRTVTDTDDGTELHLAWAGPHTLATVTGVPAADAAGLIARLAEVVAHVHRRGLTHGRLSPDHVLVGASDGVVLTGFAEARPLDPQRAAEDVAALGALLGTLVRPLEDPPIIPERRMRPRLDGSRGALLNLADRAQADDISSRPSPAELAASLRAAVPGSHRPRTRRLLGSRRRTGDEVSSASRRDAIVAGCSATVASPADSDGPEPSTGPRPGVAAALRWVRAVPGRYRMVAVLGLAAVLIVVGGLAVRPGAEPPGVRAEGAGPAPQASVPATTGPTSTGTPSSPAPSRPVPPSTSTTTAPGPPPPRAGCAPVPAPSADPDGELCPGPLRIAGERVTVGPTTWVVGRPGDELAVGDWDCDGTDTVAALRPSTGEVFVFDRWVLGGDELTVHPTVTVPGAAELGAVDPDGDGCVSLVVSDRAGHTTEVPTGRPS